MALIKIEYFHISNFISNFAEKIVLANQIGGNVVRMFELPRQCRVDLRFITCNENNNSSQFD